MKYPHFLTSKATIGIIAPSFGSQDDPYLSRVLNAQKKFMKMGYSFKISKDVFNLEKAQSANKFERAKEFENFYFDKDVDFIMSVAGGERMVEILPLIDFEKIKQSKPKFFMGFSDNTTLTFLLTTLCDIASIYAQNFQDFGMENWDESVIDCYNTISNKNNIQTSYDKYEIEDLKHNKNNKLCSYNKTEKVLIENLKNENEINVSGRIIGGCLDVLTLFCGTKYDKIKDFNEKYKNDGIIWFFEAAELNPMGVLRSLWQLKQCHWFDNANAFIFGRPANYNDFMEVSHKEAIKEVLEDLNIPIIYGADIGHLPPTITIVNGSFANITSNDNKLIIEMLYK
ncbi:MAG: S66 peptidase family protein [Bacilli bacterium]|nr:LD-carboxypeptidase [Bacilli bacterium]